MAEEAARDLLMQTHVEGTYIRAEALPPQMSDRKRGAIVNMSSGFAIVERVVLGPTRRQRRPSGP